MLLVAVARADEFDAKTVDSALTLGCADKTPALKGAFGEGSSSATFPGPRRSLTRHSNTKAVQL